MKILTILYIFLLIIVLLSCAKSQLFQTEPDYQEGYNSAREFAKNDSIESNCFLNPRVTDKDAKRHIKVLQDQSKSESYIKGFYNGYQRERIEYWELYCWEPPSRYWFRHNQMKKPNYKRSPK